MSHSEIVSEVTTQLEEYKIHIPTVEDSSIPKTKCDSPAHEHDEQLREGNRIIVLLIKSEEEGWHIVKTSCWTCSVRSLYDRQQPQHDIIAVVEGVLKETPQHVEHTDVGLDSPEVWELNTPQPN